MTRTAEETHIHLVSAPFPHRQL